MRSYVLLVASFATTLAVAAFGFADPPVSPAPPAAKGGASVGVSTGGSASGARPAPSASAGVSTPGSAAAPIGSASGSGRGDAKSKPASATLSKGHAAYMARDYPGAVQAYKDAIAEDGSDPATFYFLGEAQLAAGTTAEADNTFAAGLRNAASKDDWHSKLLFVVAELRERQGKWPEAKKAWEEYAQFLSTHPNAKGYAATATERVKVVDARADLETKYAPVKQRIEQRLKENATIPAAAAESPATPPKKK
jgi:TolA-binding protein